MQAWPCINHHGSQLWWLLLQCHNLQLYTCYIPHDRVQKRPRQSAACLSCLNACVESLLSHLVFFYPLHVALFVCLLLHVLFIDATVYHAWHHQYACRICAISTALGNSSWHLPLASIIALNSLLSAPAFCYHPMPKDDPQ